jgi:trans-aconitate methyltransferase
MKSFGQSCIPTESFVKIGAVPAGKLFAATKLKTALSIVDATCGNGYDTLFLANHCRPDATIFAFDVQAAAISATAGRLAGAGAETAVKLIHDSHENFDRYLQSIDIALFNLGYLPGSDKSVVTRAATVEQTINKMLPALTPGGLIAVVVYPGHQEGACERTMLEQLLTDLPQSAYVCARFTILNQINNPPELFLVEKKRI